MDISRKVQLAILIEMEAMKASNQTRLKAGHGFPLYDETDFMALIKKYRLREEK